MGKVRDGSRGISKGTGTFKGRSKGYWALNEGEIEGAS